MALKNFEKPWLKQKHNKLLSK